MTRSVSAVTGHAEVLAEIAAMPYRGRIDRATATVLLVELGMVEAKQGR